MSQDTNNPRPEASGASDHDIQVVHGDLLAKKQEPEQGYQILPLFMLGFVSTMIFVVAIYFIHNRAGLTDGLGLATTIQHKGYDPDKHAVDAGPVEIDPVAMGKRLYVNCAACHQPNGMGLPGAFPPLVDTEYVTGDEERLVKILLHGLQGPIEIKGTTYNGAMPAFGPTGAFNWSDDQISYVLTYIRQEWGHTASAISPEFVAGIRAATADQAAPYTADQL